MALIPISLLNRYQTVYRSNSEPPRPCVRYGREEMLALYEKGILAPDEMAPDSGVFVEKCQPPVAFSNVSEDEKASWDSRAKISAI